jgi:superfamily II DNA or RNA helicase
MGKILKIILSNRLNLSNIPRNLRQSLIEKLTLENPRWIENERMNRWNWNTEKLLRFYEKTKDGGLKIPRGYIRQLIYLCRRYHIPYEIEDRRRCLRPVKLSFLGRLKPFQQEGVDSMLSRDFGTLSAPTGSGKTVMALYMIAKRSQPTLVIVHRKDLAFQWIDQMRVFFGIPASEVGFIGGGKHEVGKVVTVALVQSLYNRLEDVVPQIGHVVVDECHRTPSRTFTEAVTAFDSRYMIGLSATPWRRDQLSRLIFWHLGGVYHEMKKSDLIESGDLLSAEIIFRETAFTPYSDPVKEYSRMLSELVADDKRNHLIASDVAQEVRKKEGVNLILSDRKTHCETLKVLLQYKFKVSSELLTGDLSDCQRRRVVDRLEHEQVSVLIATGQLIGEGFDCRALSTLFLATPIKFSGRVLQYLGRVLRPGPGKKKARVYDYVDVNVDVLKAAARARQKVYAS